MLGASFDGSVLSLGFIGKVFGHSGAGEDDGTGGFCGDVVYALGCATVDQDARCVRGYPVQRRPWHDRLVVRASSNDDLIAFRAMVLFIISSISSRTFRDQM